MNQTIAEQTDTALDATSPLSFNERMKLIEDNEEAVWAQMTSEQQLSAFNCVIRRLYQGEIVDNRTYRGVLYDVFGFGPKAYARSQMAGFLDIHNSIMNQDQEAEQLEKFAKSLGIEEEKIEEYVNKFLMEKYL